MQKSKVKTKSQNLKLFTLSFIVYLLLFIALALPAQAVPLPPQPQPGLNQPPSVPQVTFPGGKSVPENPGTGQFIFAGKSLGEIVSTMLPLLLAAGSLLSFIYLLVGAFSYLTSGGDEKAVASAQKKITFAIAGFVLMFAAYWIIKVLEALLRIKVT